MMTTTYKVTTNRYGRETIIATNLTEIEAIKFIKANQLHYNTKLQVKNEATNEAVAVRGYVGATRVYRNTYVKMY